MWYDAFVIGKWYLTFRRNLQPPSSEKSTSVTMDTATFSESLEKLPVNTVSCLKRIILKNNIRGSFFTYVLLVRKTGPFCVRQ